VGATADLPAQVILNGLFTVTGAVPVEGDDWSLLAQKGDHGPVGPPGPPATLSGDGSLLTNLPLTALTTVPLTNNQGAVSFTGLTTLNNLLARTNAIPLDTTPLTNGTVGFNSPAQAQSVLDSLSRIQAALVAAGILTMPTFGNTVSFQRQAPNTNDVDPLAGYSIPVGAVTLKGVKYDGTTSNSDNVYVYVGGVAYATLAPNATLVVSPGNLTNLAVRRSAIGDGINATVGVNTNL
jgi:hypothetical protein